MKRQQILTSVLVLGLLLALAVGLSLAQGPEPPEREAGAEGEVGAAAAVSNIIPIQGRLTDASGNPINGTRTITFTLYDRSSGGVILCQDDDNVEIANGLFNANMNFCTSSDINGQKLYLGIQVEGDPEMTPRRSIYPVPYAWSLRPGAVISGTYPAVGQGLVHVQQGETGSSGEGHYGAKLVYDDWGWWSAGVHGYARDVGSGVSGHSHAGDYSSGVSGHAYATTSVNYGGYFISYSDEGYGVYGYADHDSGDNFGVYGKTDSDDGRGVHGYASNAGGGIGVEGKTQIGSGVYGDSTSGYGVYGNTGAAHRNYGLYTGDNLWALNYHLAGAVMHVVQNTGGEALEPGDVAVFTGVAAPLEAGGPPVVQVAKAASASSTAVAGVVYSRFNVEAVTREPEGGAGLEVTPEGPASSGEYLLLVVQGPAQVKVNATTSAIQPGDLLSSAGEAGYAAKAAEADLHGVKMAMPGTVFGKALEALDNGAGLIYVFVTLQ